MLNIITASILFFKQVEPNKLQPNVTKSSMCDENLEDTNNVELCIKEVFKDDFKVALAVAQAESHLHHKVIGENVDESGEIWSRDYSIFQVNDYWHKGAEKMTAKENIYYAYNMYKNNKKGWTQWSTYNDGTYLKYLK